MIDVMEIARRNFPPVPVAAERRESGAQPFRRDLSAGGGRRPAPASAAGC